MNTPMVLGAILAGLGCTPPSQVQDSPPESDTDTDTDTDTQTDTEDPTVYKGDLDASAYPECEGEGEGDSWSGPCCVDVYCMERGEGACPDPDEVDTEALVGEQLGSGSCDCSPVDGPWKVQGEDGCCYLVGIQSCTGRPMLVDDQDRVASTVRGRRWHRARR